MPSSDTASVRAAEAAAGPPPRPSRRLLPAPSARQARVVVALLFAVSLLRGLRMPNLWSATHMTFNYSHGFVRRGLLGEGLWLLGGGSGRLFRYYLLAIIAGAIFAAGAFLLGRALARALRTDPGDPCLLGGAIVFAASPATVLLGHLIGYTDHVGICLTLAFVLVAARARRLYLVFVGAAAVGVVMALVHENLTVMFMPVILLAMICRGVIEGQSAPRPTRGRRGLVVGGTALATGLVLAATALVSFAGTRSPRDIEALTATIFRYANFPLRIDALDVLGRSVDQNIFGIIAPRWRVPGVREYLRLVLVTSLPAVGYLLAYGTRLVARLGVPGRARAALTLALWGTALGPLTLNLVGWDTARWSAIGTVGPFIAVLCLRLCFSARAPEPTAHRVPSRALPVLAVVGAILELSTDMTRFFFDGYVAHGFPFFGRIDATIEIIHSGFTWLPRG